MRILVLKLWYVVCAIFCLYSLNTLIEERYEVVILASDRSEADPLVFLICQDLRTFELNKTEMRLEELRNQLIHHFSRLKFSSVNKLVLDRLETGQYLIFKGLLCIIQKDKLEKSPLSSILSEPVYFAFKGSTFDFAQMTSCEELFDQVIVQMKGPPYSNCSEDNGRFRCLNECFKSSFRLSRYLYEGNENGTIHLKAATNRTIKEKERVCFEKCWRENCKIIQLSSILVGLNREPKTTILEAQPKMSEFDFFVQFIGLVCSFANISLNQLTPLVITFVSSKVKRRRVRIGLFCVKWAVLFLSLICCGYLYTTMFLEYKVAEKNPPRKEITRNFIKEKTVRLAICVDTNRNIVGKTMLEIEKTTDDALDDLLAGIYLNYQGRKFRVNYILEPKVLFKKILDMFDSEILSRCFSLLVLPDYQLMLSNPKLTIKLNLDIFSPLELYILTKNEDLNEETFRYSPERSFMKRVVKRLKRGGCVNYRERYVNCTSRRQCVERCTTRGALDKFKKILIGKKVVDKDQFSPEEWSTTYQIGIPHYGPDRTTYQNLSEECEKKFQDERPCLEVTFNETAGIIPSDIQTKEIDLLLDVELSIEEFSWFKLLLDILNIQSIFFGMTVLKLLRMLYNFFKLKLRMRNEKIVQYLFYLLCSIGFTYHTYRIFSLSIHGELIYSPNYEIGNTVRMPFLVFCFPIEENLIDRNQQLTGNYLDHVASDMKANSVFESILYLNELNEWIPFNFSLVEKFFFLHFKCFNITIDLEYDRRQFHFSANSQVANVLKVKFIDRSWNKKTIFFMTKTNETTGFSNIANLVHDLMEMALQYSTEQSELTVKYEDRFSFIKRLLSTSYDDDFNDLDGQLPELKSGGFNFKTLKIPVKKRNFGCELRDDLLDQLFNQIKTKTTSNWLDSLDYQKMFVFNHLKGFEYKDLDSDFTFSLSLVKKTLSAKNEENFAKLALNLLNVLFLWFDLGILDLHPIFILTHDYLLVYLYLHLPVYLFNKITQFLLFSRRWLKKFEKPLYKRLDAHQKNSPQTPQA